MKHQYFGDINDYRKYGLLRAFQRHTGLRLGVCWMLTPGDGRSDGKFIEYLGQPSRWRRYDPDLFDVLRATVPLGRTVSHLPDRGLLSDAVFVDALVPDREPARDAYFALALSTLQRAELVFLDPDNGIEVPSCPVGRKGSSKYVRWSELAALYRRGQSILVYQHFRREERSGFVLRMMSEIRRHTGAPTVSSYLTSNVVFFLIPQACHTPLFRRAAPHIESEWQPQIECRVEHGDTAPGVCAQTATCSP